MMSARTSVANPGEEHSVSISPKPLVLLPRKIEKRVECLALEPQTLFPAECCDSETEKLKEIGEAAFKERYGEKAEFKGYTLFRDPFDPESKEINFALGTDCSHFVHRIYQIMGASYPYAKTRDFIHVFKAKRSGVSAEDYYATATASGVPIKMKPEEWVRLYNSFTIVKPADVKPSDLVVVPKEVGEYGKRGHVMMVKTADPLEVIHAKNKDEGIVVEPLAQAEENVALKDLYYLRWTGSLAAVPNVKNYSDFIR